MIRQALVPNIHDTNFEAVVRDLHDLHFEIYCPVNTPTGPSNPSCSKLAENITMEEYMQKPAGFIFVFTANQYNYFNSLKQGDKIVYCPATRYEGLINPEDDNPLLSHEPKHYREYTGRKMWYFYRPKVLYKPKDIDKCFRDRQFSQIYNLFQDRDPQGWLESITFNKIFPGTKYYGSGQPDGTLDLSQKSRVMSEAFFQVYFKSAGWCGCTVLESMQLGTPIATLKSLVGDGDYLLTEKNSIVANGIVELVDRLNKITLAEYRAMCEQCVIDIEEKMDDNKRKDNLIKLLFPS